MPEDVGTATGWSEEQHDTDAVKKFAQLVLATKDSREVLRLLRLHLREMVPGQRHSILFYNESSRYFYVDADLNGSSGERDGAAVLHEADTGLAQILSTRCSMTRTFVAATASRPEFGEDAGHGVRPTAAERQFFGDQLVSELAVPILAGDRVLGVLHFAGDRADCFSLGLQRAAEAIAALAALALERTRLLEYAQRKKDEATWWRDRYYRLFRAAGQAMALVNWKDDLIYESNDEFARLSGRGDTELQGMHLTDVFVPESRVEVMLACHRMEHSEQTTRQDVLLGRTDGGRVPVRLTLYQVPSRRGVAIAVLQDLQPESGQQVETRRRSRELLEMMKVWKDLATYASVEEMLAASIGRLGESFAARYVGALLTDANSNELKLVQARKIGSQRQELGLHPYLAGLGEGPYAELLAENKVVTIPDVFVDPRFARWRPIAEKLGYASLVAVPLLAQDRALGLLCLFFERSRSSSEHDVNFLCAVTAYLSMAIDNRRLFSEASAHAKQIAVINEITRSINSSLDLGEVIRITALETRRVVDFDLASISLFDHSGENAWELSVGSRRLADRFLGAADTPAKQASLQEVWSGFYEGAALGWWRGEAGGQEQTLVPKSWLRSEMSAVLISHERFLGTLAIYSLDANAYRAADGKFLKQIADQMAIAIGNARQFGESQQRVSEFSVLAQVAKSVSGSLEIEDTLQQIMKAVVRTLGVRACRVQLVGDGFGVAEQQYGAFPAFDWLAKSEHRQVLIEKCQPLIIKNLVEYFSGSTPAAGDRRGGPVLRGALLAHPVAIRERVLGILYAWWEEAHAISQHDIELMTTIAGQAASAIENARMYKESLINAKQLEKVNEELENFVFTVSHDLKSPIISIQGFSSMMLSEYKDRLDETSLHYLDRIQSNAKQMEQLIADLLELSRIGRVVNPFAEVPALDIVNGALSEFAYTLNEKKIELHMQEDLPVIWCDPQRLCQVFANLIGNAIKFTSQQPQPRIEIGGADKGSHLLFFVKDNGVGIDEKYHEKIFGLFQGLQQLKGVKGTGVGLTIVRRIIDNHGGKVWVESSEGNGATFYFTLPKKATAGAVAS